MKSTTKMNKKQLNTEFSSEEIIAIGKKAFEEAKAWILAIRDSQRLEKVMVGMEPTGHYWFNLASWLMNEGIPVVAVTLNSV